ncbi:hypothetical protein SDC9_212494 [bioreactor metagenome]|uniref:Uncharacterized protein n=1 Tax=bioreactor metagenome TaxID=1076179 RepID=A0A645JM38_9ZZZZ
MPLCAGLHVDVVQTGAAHAEQRQAVQSLQNSSRHHIGFADQHLRMFPFQQFMQLRLVPQRNILGLRLEKNRMLPAQLLHLLLMKGCGNYNFHFCILFSNNSLTESGWF